MNSVLLALGSNLASPRRQLRLAIQALRKIPRIRIQAVAPFYKNPAFGRRAQPVFYNTVMAVKTTLPPYSLLRQCQKIEKQQGRTRRVTWGARTLDIDILSYAKIHLRTPRLTLPHPKQKERDFVLIPLQSLSFKKHYGRKDAFDQAKKL